MYARGRHRPRPGHVERPNTYIVEESAGLHIAQSLKRHGRRVLVHDYAACPKNSPSLLEFEFLDDFKMLRNEKRVTAVLICCPWEGYRAPSSPAEQRCSILGV